MKTTAIAPSNIAFIKYWGKRDEELRIPANGSISMNLSNLTTTTTVEFSDALRSDDIIIDGKREEKEKSRISKHLDRIRKRANINKKAKVVSENSFPSSTGLSSSASGFAALTVAASHAAGLTLPARALSILARKGSGSACRSIPDGFVEWVDGTTDDTSYAVSLHPPDYWDIVDIVTIVSSKQKDVPTSEGQTRISTNPFFETRLVDLPNKIKKNKQLIKQKNFKEFGELIETEALELHAVMMTSRPPLIYLLPETLNLMRKVMGWRSEGLPVYFTINTGQNIHLISEKKNVERILSKLEEIEAVKSVIVNTASKGARLVGDHSS